MIHGPYVITGPRGAYIATFTKLEEARAWIESSDHLDVIVYGGRKAFDRLTKARARGASRRYGHTDPTLGFDENDGGDE